MNAVRAVMFVGLASFVAAQEPIRVEDRLEPFIDRALIERMDGVALRLHAPVPAGTALQLDQSWEGGLSGYFTVLRDGARYRMYYRGRPVVEAGDGAPQAREVTCVAFSDDGITWDKPALGLVELGGSTANNVILAEPAPVTHNFAPFLDARDGTPRDERFKALGGTVRSGGLLAFASEDGLRWQQIGDGPVITEGAFDSQNVAFWSNRDHCYVCYLRVFVDGVRWVARATSEDFRTWTEPVSIETPGAPREHLYTNQTEPYCRAPHIELATPARFWPGRRALTVEQIDAIDLRGEGRYRGLAGGTSDVVLMTSRQAGRFDRTFLESWIRPGLDPRSFVARANYPARGVVPTGPHELSVYVQRDYGQPSARLERMTLRMDGFVSVQAGYAGGEMLTRPLVFGHVGRIRPAAPDRRGKGPAWFEEGLQIRGPVAIRLPGTEELGRWWTLAVRLDRVPAGHRRLVSAYDGGSTVPGELVFDFDSSGASIGGEGPIRFLYDDVRVVAPPGSVPDWSEETRECPPQWLAVTWDDGEVSIYLNGARVARGGSRGRGAVTLRLGDLLLGEDYPPTSRIDEPLLGTVDRILLVRRVLQPEELSPNGLAQVPPPRDRERGSLWTMAPGEEWAPDLTIPRAPAHAARRLELNVSTSAAGEVAVELQDVDGAPIPGFASGDCDPVIGDQIDRVVTWRGNAELAGLEGRTLRVRFVLRDADLYAMRFR